MSQARATSRLGITRPKGHEGLNTDSTDYLFVNLVSIISQTGHSNVRNSHPGSPEGAILVIHVCAPHWEQGGRTIDSKVARLVGISAMTHSGAMTIQKCILCETAGLFGTDHSAEVIPADHKSGHCRFQNRPLGVGTGQKLAVLSMYDFYPRLLAPKGQRGAFRSIVTVHQRLGFFDGHFVAVSRDNLGCDIDFIILDQIGPVLGHGALRITGGSVTGLSVTDSRLSASQVDGSGQHTCDYATPLLDGAGMRKRFVPGTPSR
jgi:hypothetical protein